ncbi:MAG: sigma-54-dependent Fis family transcriptional regulator [bacterium]|nr:MAG: sigma-54-dependent Fis family transcriptional regulator [bacterium]
MHVLLIDDDINLCKVIGYQLEKQGFRVTTAHRGKDGLRLFSQKDIDVVLTDIQMPDISGIDVLQNIRQENQQVVIILITAYGSVDNALEACRLGADDYITKPFGQEQLLFVIEKAVRLRKLQLENEELKDELAGKFRFEKMVVKSDAMQKVIQNARKVAQSDATVLILGESGTGKELLARSIHFNSPRRDKPFIVVNCPSIPNNLIESELFGHVRGAFTGAIKDRKGKFELADGGTLFLDEIGDLQESVQANLLRVLQEKEFERLGDSRIIQVDVQLLAATNKNLEQLTKEGKFREDLYYRLSVVPLTIPPLRNRKDDIPDLVRYFIQQFGHGRDIPVSAEVLQSFQEYHWPGNIRELENTIERALVLGSGSEISIDNVPPHISQKPGKTGDELLQLPFDDFSLENAERQLITLALQKSRGNQTRAAGLLKIPRHVLLYRMKKWKIQYQK